MKKITALLIALLFTILFGVFSVVSSQNGSLWILGLLSNPITALTLQGVRGNFVTGFSFQSVQWAPVSAGGKEQEITLENGNISWKFRDLLLGQLTVTNLNIENISIKTTDHTTGNLDRKEPDKFTQLYLPMSLNLKSLLVDELVLTKISGGYNDHEGEERTENRMYNVKASIAMIGNTLSLNNLSLNFNEYSIRAKGEILTSSDYPLTFTGKISNEQQPLDIDFIAEGSLPKISTRLELNAPKKLSLELELYPFNTAVLFKGKAAMDKLLNDSFLADSEIHFHDTPLMFSGTPQRINFSVDGRLYDPGSEVENKFMAEGIWTNNQEVQIKHFSMLLLQGELTAAGRFKIGEEYTLKSDVQLSGIQIGGVSQPVSGGGEVAIEYSVDNGLRWHLQNIDIYSVSEENPLLLTGHVSGIDLLPSDVNLNLTQDQNSLSVSGGLTEGGEGDNWEVKFTGNASQLEHFDLSCSGTFENSIGGEVSCYQGLFVNILNNTKRQWTFDDPVKIRFLSESKEVQVQPFCLRTEETSLCSKTEVHFIQGNDLALPITISHIPWSWFSTYFPQDVELKGFINGSTILKLAATGAVKAELNLESDNAHVIVRHKENESLDIRFQSMKAKGNWADDKSNIEISIATAGRGFMNGDLSLDADMQILGAIDISDFDIENFEIFLDPDDNLNGVLHANLNFSGALASPQVKGGFKVEQGSYQTTLFPVEAKDIDIVGEFNNSTANFTGSFSTADGDGDGQISGVLDWSQAQWTSEFNLKAERLLFSPDKNTRIWITPSVTVKAEPLQIAISGDILVPKARIEIEELPKVAAIRSSDVVIIDQETNEQVWEYSTQLNVKLGDDVKFKGFGLEARLTGQVDVFESNNLPLSALGGIQLQDGKYDSFGQSLTVRRGDLIFAGQLENPDIQIEAIRNDIVEDDVVVGLKVTGRAHEPLITLFSEPNMSEQNRLSYLLTGKLPSDAEGGSKIPDSKTMLSQAAIGLSISQSEGTLSKAAGKLGVDNFQVGASAGEEGVEEVRLSGRINEKLYVQYGLGVFDKLNSIMLRYQVKQGLYLEAMSGKVNSLDLMFSFDRD